MYTKKDRKIKSNIGNEKKEARWTKDIVNMFRTWVDTNNWKEINKYLLNMRIFFTFFPIDI